MERWRTKKGALSAVPIRTDAGPHANTQKGKPHMQPHTHACMHAEARAYTRTRAQTNMRIHIHVHNMTGACQAHSGAHLPAQGGIDGLDTVVKCVWYVGRERDGHAVKQVLSERALLWVVRGNEQRPAPAEGRGAHTHTLP